jgi:prenyltransferase beta subunit
MLHAASLAPSLLPELGATEAFLKSRWTEAGGFRGRHVEADLYYTVFGLSGLAGLGADFDAWRVGRFLAGFDPSELDLVHLSSLVRCQAILRELGGAGAQVGPRVDVQKVLARLEQFRARDGGYSLLPDMPVSTPYACFLTIGLCQDVQCEFTQARQMPSCLESCRAGDGGYANLPGQPAGSTPATAAAMQVLDALGLAAPPELAGWLSARRDASGGFAASPAAPVPDLLSTAVALHALSGAGFGLRGLRDRCLAFVLGLGQADGGFRAHQADDLADCEYTFYALLALGALA